MFIGRERLLVQQGNLIADLPDPRLEFLRRFAPRALAANLLAQSFPIGVELLQSGFRLATFRVHAQYFIDPGDILVPPAGDEPALHKIGLFADEPNVEHVLGISAPPTARKSSSFVLVTAQWAAPRR